MTELIPGVGAGSAAALAAIGRRPLDPHRRDVPHPSAETIVLTYDKWKFDGDDDSSPDGPVLEGGADRLEVLGEPRVVAVESVGSVEREVLGVEVRVDLLLALAGDL
jgi:hypothetical protein